MMRTGNASLRAWMAAWMMQSLCVCLAGVTGCGSSDGDGADAGGDGDGDGDGDDGSGGQSAAGFTECNLQGSWAMHRVAFATADSALVTGPQKSSRWFYLEVSQDGDEVTFDRALWCGDLTTGSATVSFSADSFAALQPMMTADGRRGSFSASGDGCAISIERVYWLLGVSPRETYLPEAETPPGRIPDDPALADLPPMPEDETDDGVVDADGDGTPGIRMLLVDTPLGSGVRHALQRGWDELSGEATGGDDDFMVPVAYDFEQIALSAMPAAFNSGAFVREGSPHVARFVRVQDDFAGSDDIETCDSVQELLPHRKMPAGEY